MSFFVILKKVRLRFEKIPRDLLWGSGALEKKAHFTRWQVVFMDGSQGGLGIRRQASLI